jgi:chromosome segregation ATPase
MANLKKASEDVLKNYVKLMDAQKSILTRDYNDTVKEIANLTRRQNNLQEQIDKINTEIAAINNDVNVFGKKP